MWCIRSRWIAATSRAGRPSLLASDVLRCVDGAQVLRVGATTQLPFTEAAAELKNETNQRNYDVIQMVLIDYDIVVTY